MSSENVFSNAAPPPLASPLQTQDAQPMLSASSTEFRSLTEVLNNQFELQKQMLAEELQLQQTQLNARLKLQHEFLASQLDILRKHVERSPVPGAVAAYKKKKAGRKSNLPLDDCIIVNVNEPQPEPLSFQGVDEKEAARSTAAAMQVAVPGSDAGDAALTGTGAVTESTENAPTFGVSGAKVPGARWQPTSSTRPDGTASPSMPVTVSFDAYSSLDGASASQATAQDSAQGGSEKQALQDTLTKEERKTTAQLLGLATGKVQQDIKSSRTMHEKLKEMADFEGNRKIWVRSCGLHCVDDWVSNYRNHPSGWAALLMIHGIPEVTQRLRLKVQNLGMFAGLFLAATIRNMGSHHPSCRTYHPDVQQGFEASTECHIRRRVYSYCFMIELVAHVTCILLCISFHNALNEAARDSDVYRMFARGKGYYATVKCEVAFIIGAVACLAGMTAHAQESAGWDVVIFMVTLMYAAYKIWRNTSNLLLSSSSIRKYWREELGGNPDASDPYDLGVPLKAFKRLVETEGEGYMDIAHDHHGWDGEPLKREASSRKRGNLWDQFVSFF